MCIVKSYLLWLQDSDYLPICSLCNRSLSDEGCGECIRLTCYDVFHWLCLHNHCQQLPSTTAPAGYTCPSCNTCIFPPVKLVTPVALAVRRQLQQVNWARAGLGLPLIDEDQLPPPPARLESHTRSDRASAGSSETGLNTQDSVPLPASTTMNTVVGFHSIFSSDDANSARQFSSPRKWFDSTKDDGLFTQRSDHDENKYRRRPALQWLADWFRSSVPEKRRGERSAKRRTSMFLIICLLSFITLIIIFSQLGQHAADDDPFLDPMNNPNIKVEQKLVKLQ
ncbi:zinc finger protein-like 1 isoform X2 [Babylonia areolata]|uniref:zinc finger protein-like 1 isoform X2 n=1 Tax=Babylonia areolata TaxID=304850 RepID=UPI003FD5EFE0